MAKQQSTMNMAAQAGSGELFSRLKFLFLAIVVYRIGTHIPVPGINPVQLEALFNQNSDTILGCLICFRVVLWSA